MTLLSARVQAVDRNKTGRVNLASALNNKLILEGINYELYSRIFRAGELI